MIDNNHELTICELDAVNGGFIQGDHLRNRGDSEEP
jgi:bacteriocin-like protein